MIPPMMSGTLIGGGGRFLLSRGAADDGSAIIGGLRGRDLINDWVLAKSNLDGWAHDQIEKGRD